MDTEILKGLGLTENEIKVYLVLLKRGPSLASEVAEETGLHRTHAYDIIHSLVKKSIVSYVVRENRKYFQSTDPEHLDSLLKDKQEELEKSEAKLKSLIGELKEISVSNRPELVASIYEGQRGFKAFLEDILKRKENYLIIGYNPQAEEFLKYFLPGFNKRRVAAKISRRAIVDPKLKGGGLIKKMKMQEIRYFKYDFPMGIVIYGNRVVMTIIQEGHQLAIVLENEKVANNFRRLFEGLWEQAEE
ncbi:MAG: helix-turn-helix domain-containing protein [archaeon]